MVSLYHLVLVFIIQPLFTSPILLTPPVLSALDILCPNAKVLSDKMNTMEIISLIVGLLCSHSPNGLPPTLCISSGGINTFQLSTEAKHNLKKKTTKFKITPPLIMHFIMCSLFLCRHSC